MMESVSHTPRDSRREREKESIADIQVRWVMYTKDREREGERKKCFIYVHIGEVQANDGWDAVFFLQYAYVC